MIHSTIFAPSHSRLQCVHQCKRKYWYQYRLGLKNKTEFAPAFAGSAGHAGLEAWHRSGNAIATGEAAAALWGTKEFHGDFGFLSGGHLGCILANYTESKHTQDWEVVRLRWSDLKHDRLLQTDVLVDTDGYLILAEASFVIDIPGLGPLNCRPDLLTRVASGLRVVDHKFTVGYLGSKMYNQAKFGHQLRLYALALGALLDEPITEGLVNGIYMGEKASSLGFGGKRFDCFGPFDYTASDFEETKAWYRSGIEEMKMLEALPLEVPQAELQAPQNPTDRCGYCDYAVLCAAPAAYRSNLVKLQFKRAAT